MTPTQLVATPPPPSPVAVDHGLTLTVTAEDKAGNTAIAFDSPVTVAIASGPTGATLDGTLTETADLGVATFTGLTLNELGSVHALTVTGGDLVGHDRPYPDRTAGLPVQVVITTEPPASVGTGEAFKLSWTTRIPWGSRTILHRRRRPWC